MRAVVAVMVLPMAMLPPAPFGAPIPVAAMVTPVMSVVTMAARNDLNLIGCHNR